MGVLGPVTLSLLEPGPATPSSLTERPCAPERIDGQFSADRKRRERPVIPTSLEPATLDGNVRDVLRRLPD
jgi:hypothetical protein